MAVLSAQQEKFALAMARGLNQSDAYMEAYPASRKWPKETLYPAASKLANDSKVSTRIDALRAPVARKVGYTLETAMREAEKAYEAALEHKQVGAAVAAAQLRAKLQGLLIERKEIAVTKMDGMDANDKQTLIEAAKAEIERRRRLAGPEQEVTDVEPKS